MTDSVQLLWDLGSLAQEAAQRGDDRAAVIARQAAEFIMLLNAEMASLDRRRAKDRSRKRERSAESAESTERAEIHAGSLLPVPSPRPSPLTPPLSEDTPTPRAREAAGPSVVRDVDAEYAAQVEQVTAEVTKQCPAECWPALDAFLRRRQYVTWHGWLKAFLQGAMSTTWPDVAAVCTDDSALDRPIGTPKGFRVFLASAKRDRIAPPAPTTSHAPRGNKLEIGRANIESAINRRERERAAAGGNHGE